MPLIRNLDGNVFANTTTAYDSITPSTNPIKARENDLIRLTKRLTSPSSTSIGQVDVPVGAIFTAKQTLLRTSPALTDLASALVNRDKYGPSEIADLRKKALVAAAEAASHIATILAQVPVNGTGTHFLYNEILRLTSLGNDLYYAGNGNATNEALYKGTITVNAKRGKALDADLKFGGAGQPDMIGQTGIGNGGEIQDKILQDTLPVVFSIVGESNSFLIFRGFVTGLTNSFNANWNAVNYVGRGEAMYTYSNSSRGISFKLQVPMFSASEQEITYKKVNSLVSHIFPKYEDNLPQGTLTKLQIGDYFNHFCVINSITDTVDVNVPWSLGFAELTLPQVLNLQINAQVIHRNLPTRYLGNSENNVLPYIGTKKTNISKQ